MLIVNGRVHDGCGNSCAEDIRIEDGVIAALGQGLAAKPEEQIIDAAGMEILPGFVQAISSWGVNGSMAEIRPSSDDNDEKSNPVMPELDGFYAFNGRAATAQQLGAFGVTACGVAPTTNNLFGGTIAAFCVDGVNPYRMVLGRDLGMMASVMPDVKKTYGARPAAPMTRMWLYTNLAEWLRKAAEYEEKEDKPKDTKLIALRRVVRGELPLFASCDSAASIAHVLDITAAYPDLRLVLVNGFGLTGDEDYFLERSIPLIVRTPSNPLDKDAMGLDYKAVVKLYEKGVKVAMSGAYSNSMNAREDMLWFGAELMRILHDSDKVLPMLTSMPAGILGIGDKTGSVAVGKRADLVVWSADPLKTYQARVQYTLQAGRIIYQEGDEMKCM